MRDDAPFNMQQWTEAHDLEDARRFDDVKTSVSSIWKVLAFVGVTFVGISGWSLKTQYDTMRENEAHAQQQLNALYAVSGQVSHVETMVPKVPR